MNKNRKEILLKLKEIDEKKQINKNRKERLLSKLKEINEKKQIEKNIDNIIKNYPELIEMYNYSIKNINNIEFTSEKERNSFEEVKKDFEKSESINIIKRTIEYENYIEYLKKREIFKLNNKDFNLKDFNELENEGFKLENEGFKLKNESFKLKNEGFKLENEDFKLENEDFYNELKNEGFYDKLENEDFNNNILDNKNFDELDKDLYTGLISYFIDVSNVKNLLNKDM